MEPRVDALADVTEKELLVAILAQLRAMNETFRRVYAQPIEPATCCADPQNRLALGTPDAPGRWMCRLCGASGG